MKIQWRKVTWYSKAIAMVIFVAVPFIGFYFGIMYGRTIEFIKQSTAERNLSSYQDYDDVVENYYEDTSSWQTDINQQAKFSVAYPIDFDTQDYNSGTKYFSLTVPRDFQPQTNFGGMMFTISGDKSASAITQCMTNNINNGVTEAPSSVTINNIPFTVFHSSDAGAGNYYETTSYHTIHAGQCYILEYTVHSSQIANYPSSYNLKPYSSSQVNSLMENIIKTFKFL